MRKTFVFATLILTAAAVPSLADAPISQSFAVTGSVNQLGQVQAIGAVDESRGARP